MNRIDAVWAVGRLTIQPLTKLSTPLRNYAPERIPAEGGVVLAMNHFSWLDPPAFGSCCPRTIHFLAKSEIHSHFGLGHLIRAFGTRSVRRGESDRDAVRAMREIVRDGFPLGLFVEGTRQKSGVPGQAMPGAGMVALQEEVPVIPAAIHGSQFWQPWNRHPVSVAWGQPMQFEGIPRGGKGYRAASLLIQEEIHRLWRWLVEQHELGRPAGATPP
jgi:1-acyl-sn-glycerol-3-phosphate acyltransferase